MKLTDISVRNLPSPDKGQRTYFDDALPAFGCRVSQGGTISFVVVAGPERQRITIGRYPVISLQKARAVAKEILAERTLGKNRPQSIPHDEAVKLFLAGCQQRLRPRTLRDYTRLLKRHFPFGRKQLSDIRPQDINRRIDRLHQTPAEQNHALAVAKIFFRWAQRRHYIDRSPCEGMGLPARLSPRERVLSDEELAAVYRTALGDDDNFSFIVALLVLTAQRRSEIGLLRWEWIDERDRTITLPSDITKNRRTHTFPYGDVVADIFSRIPRDSEYVFPASRVVVRGIPTTAFNAWSKCKDAFDKRCPSAPWTLHDLRRTAATGMARLRIPPHIVERVLNHVSGTFGGVTGIYNRFSYLDEMRAALETWEKHVSSLPGSAVSIPVGDIWSSATSSLLHCQHE